jgi:hypothetical protein
MDDSEIDPRRVRIGMAIIGGITVVAFVLMLAIDDATARVVFGFVVVAGLIQTWRIRRNNRSLQ